MATDRALGEVRTRRQAWQYFLEQVLGNNDGRGYHIYRTRLTDDLKGLCDDWEEYCDYLLDQERISTNQNEMWKIPKHYPRPLYSNIKAREQDGDPTGKPSGNPAFSENRKLTDIDVKAIKNLLIMDTWSMAKMAEEFGVKVLTIKRIKNGTRYRRIRVPNDEGMKWAERMRKR